MKSINTRNEVAAIDCRETLFPFSVYWKSAPTLIRKLTPLHGWILISLLLLSGCIHVPLSSEITIHDPLQGMQPVEQGEVVLVYGENAPVPEQSIAGPYFTANCAATTQVDTIGELIKTILRVNPQPGRFAIRHLKDQEMAKDPDDMTSCSDSILCQLNLSKGKVLADRLRYAIHVKENFEAKVHVPLYIVPFGIASCANKTVLETTVWELPTARRIGSFSVSAEGEYTVLAYMLHIVVTRDTQKDAMERLAREITERLTGLKSL